MMSNMTISCTKQLKFECAHRLVGHEGRCSSIHGHSYVVEVTAFGPKLDSVGRLVDFSVIKKTLGTWIDENWDHALIYNQSDLDVVKLGWLKGNRAYAVSDNPTAENMCYFLLKKFCKSLEYLGVIIGRISVWETDTAFATCDLNQGEISDFCNIASEYLSVLEILKAEASAAEHISREKLPIQLTATQSEIRNISWRKIGAEEWLPLESMILTNVDKVFNGRYDIKRVYDNDQKPVWLLNIVGY
jgi:6-pyruvoyltetrahydropterin/6-carboxytetrahydropterin synthase